MTAGLSRLAERATHVAAVVLLLGLLTCVVLGVVSRGLNQPLAWTDEMAQHLLVWMGFTGWMIASRRRSHIRINVFIDRLPKAPRLVAEVIIQLSVIVLAVALLWYSPSVIGRNLDIEWVSLPISAALLYLPIPIAALALLLQSLAEIRDALLGRVFEPDAGVQPL